MTELKINEDNKMSDTKNEKKIEELKYTIEEKAKELKGIEQHYWKKVGGLEELTTQLKCLMEPNKDK